MTEQVPEPDRRAEEHRNDDHAKGRAEEGGQISGDFASWNAP